MKARKTRKQTYQLTVEICHKTRGRVSKAALGKLFHPIVREWYCICFCNKTNRAVSLVIAGFTWLDCTRRMKMNARNRIWPKKRTFYGRKIAVRLLYSIGYQRAADKVVWGKGNNVGMQSQKSIAWAGKTSQNVQYGIKENTRNRKTWNVLKKMNQLKQDLNNKLSWTP